VAAAVLCVHAAAQGNTSIMAGAADPIHLTELIISPETTELLSQGAVSVRWRGATLPLIARPLEWAGDRAAGGDRRQV